MLGLHHGRGAFIASESSSPPNGEGLYIVLRSIEMSPLRTLRGAEPLNGAEDFRAHEL